MRSYVGEPHRVTIWPKELTPFAIRFHFHVVEDESGARELWVVGREVFAPALPDDEPVDARLDWSPRHERTLAEMAFGYRRFATLHLENQLDEAGRKRSGMLALSDEVSKRKRPEEVGDLTLVALEREVEARRLMPYTDLARIAGELDMSRTKLWRLRKEAKRRREAR